MSPINYSNEFDVLKTSEIEIKVHNFVDDIKKDMVKKYKFYMTYFAFIFLFFKSFNKAKIDSQYKQKIRIKIITWFSLMPIFVGMYAAILGVFTWHWGWTIFTISTWVMLGVVFIILVFLLPYLILDSFNKKIKKDYPKSSNMSNSSYNGGYDSYYMNKKDYYENSRSIFKDFHRLSSFRKNTIFFGYFITSFFSMTLIMAIIFYLLVYFIVYKKETSNAFWALLTFIIAISILLIKTFCSVIYLLLVGRKIKSFPYFYLSTFLAIFFPVFGDILLGYFLYLLQKHLKKYPL